MEKTNVFEEKDLMVPREKSKITNTVEEGIKTAKELKEVTAPGAKKVLAEAEQLLLLAKEGSFLDFENPENNSLADYKADYSKILNAATEKKMTKGVLTAGTVGVILSPISLPVSVLTLIASSFARNKFKANRLKSMETRIQFTLTGLLGYLRESNSNEERKKLGVMCSNLNKFMSIIVKVEQ